MARTPEGKVKDWLYKKMETRYPESWRYSPPAGPFGVIGVADSLWVIKAGQHLIFVAVECKADSSCVPTTPQIKYLTKMKSLGAVAAVMKGKDTAKLLSIFKAIDDRKIFLESLPKVEDLL